MEGADRFLICIFKYAQSDRLTAVQFLKDFERTARDKDGKIPVRSEHPTNWVSVEGGDHREEPNHLQPAAFDFNCILLLAFAGDEDIHKWWFSDEVFALLKNRSCMAKIGIFVIDGLQESFDIRDTHRTLVGERLILFEFLKLEAFKAPQQYVDDYKRFAQTKADGSRDVNLLFAEGISKVLMNEFPLGAACASLWRSQADMQTWYESDVYQEQLKPLRAETTSCHVVLMPMFEERLDMLLKAKKEISLAVSTRLVLSPRRASGL